jgi:RES domain-containing protein
VLTTTFRLASYETPLWAGSNFTAGRYNRANADPTQYLSLHPMTPWAELLRNEDRRTRERAVLLRYPLWAIKVELADAPFELTFENAGEVGLAPEDLVSDDRLACQAFAAGQRGPDGGIQAFIAPSAALPFTRNLVILDPAVATFYEAKPVGIEDLPTAMAAQDGRCPESLWELVHYEGVETPHPALEAWRAGEEFVFREPEVDPAILVALDGGSLIF